MVKRPRLFFEFGQFHLDVERSRLIRDGELVSLPPKAITLLLILLKHSGRAVEKEELIESLWPNGVVEDSNLTQTVHLLRKALGKYPDSDTYIETLPRFGYRLVADVRELWSEGMELTLKLPASAPAINSEQVTSAARETQVTENTANLLQPDNNNAESDSSDQKPEQADGSQRFGRGKTGLSTWLRSFAWLKNVF